MIPHSAIFDQPTLASMLDYDPVVQGYHALFALLDWTAFIPAATPGRPKRGQPAHPATAYVKAFLVKLNEGHIYMTDLRRFLVKHPLLVLELGFRLELDAKAPYGFDVERTVPTASWLRIKLQTFDPWLLQDLLHATVHALQAEIPGLGETIAVDVKHIYARVKENNPRVSMRDRFCKDRQPRGDPDCRVGVKRSTNQEQPDGSTKVHKEYLWGYGSGVVSAITADYGDVVLAEFTQPFNEGDVTYYRPLYLQTVATLGFYPTYVTADAAFDAWYVYQTAVYHRGIAAIPLNQHAHPIFPRDPDGVPRCPKGMRMQPTYQFAHTHGYRAQRFRCPLLFPQRTGQSCDHEQFAKGKGCVKDINIELGGQMRVTLDRTSPLYKAIYRQRTSTERVNSQAQALGIERPRVRNGCSVRNLNTLTYILINVRALQRARSINTRLLRGFRLIN